MYTWESLPPTAPCVGIDDTLLPGVLGVPEPPDGGRREGVLDKIVEDVVLLAGKLILETR